MTSNLEFVNINLTESRGKHNVLLKMVESGVLSDEELAVLDIDDLVSSISDMEDEIENIEELLAEAIESEISTVSKIEKIGDLDHGR